MLSLRSLDTPFWLIKMGRDLERYDLFCVILHEIPFVPGAGGGGLNWANTGYVGERFSMISIPT